MLKSRLSDECPNDVLSESDASTYGEAPPVSGTVHVSPHILSNTEAPSSFQDQRLAVPSFSPEMLVCGSKMGSVNTIGVPNQLDTPGIQISDGRCLVGRPLHVCSDLRLKEEELLLEEKELELKRKRLELERERLKLSSCAPSETGDANCGTQSVGPQTVPLPCNEVVRSLESSLKSLVLGVGLPKIEVESFDGNPRDFYSFVQSFECGVADRLSDDGQKLSYLLYYCKGIARDAIRHCTLLPKGTGYREAVNILRRQFGRPHEIMHSLTREIFHGPRLVMGDTEGLSRLVRGMISCHTTLGQMGQVAELNCSTNLVRVVSRLPGPMQERWAERAERSIISGREPTFSDLISFLEERLSVAKSRYGQLVNHWQPRNYPRPSNCNATMVAAAPPSSLLKCPLCQAGHDLCDCERFAAASLPERRDIARDNKRCFICLKANHVAKSCKVRIRCSVPGCGKVHHSLMHYEPTADYKLKPPASMDCGATHTGVSRVRLGYVPVEVLSGDVVVSTYAFVDNGSDTTLISQDLVDRLGLQGHPQELLIRTLHGSKSETCRRVDFRLRSITGDCTLEVKGACALKKLPCQSVPIQTPKDTQGWPHLRDLSFDYLEEDRIDLLLGCDVPEAHWVCDQRIGNKGEPFAVKSPLGWILRGPMMPQPAGLAQVHCVVGTSLHQQVADMYELESSKDEWLDVRQDSVEDDRALRTAKSSAHLANGHYEISLPWRTPGSGMPTNRWMAERRLSMLKSRLLRNADLRDKYHDIILRHLSKGYISKVTEEHQSIQR